MEKSPAVMNQFRLDCREAVNMVLTLLCGVSNKWTEKLLQFFASTGGAYDVPRFMLLQRYHDQ